MSEWDRVTLKYRPRGDRLTAALEKAEGLLAAADRLSGQDIVAMQGKVDAQKRRAIKAEGDVARLQQERDQVRDALDEVRVESRDEIWYFSPNEAEAFMRRVSRWWVGFVLSVVPRR